MGGTRYGSWIFGLKNWVDGGIIDQDGQEGGRDGVGRKMEVLGQMLCLF